MKAQRYLLTIGIISLACFLLAKLTAITLNLGVEASPVWAPAGIALAGLLLCGRSVWTGVALGTFLVGLSFGVSWLVAGVAAAGSTVSAIVAKALLDRIQFRPALRSLRDVLGFVALAVIVSPAVNATISTFNACLSGLNQWSEFGAHWIAIWMGDGIGILIITPLLLTWLGEPYPNKPSLRSFINLLQRNSTARGKLIEALVWLTLLLVTSWFVFCSNTHTKIAHYPLEYLTFPFIIWAALSLGQRGTVLGSLLVSLIAIWGAVQGRGPFIAESQGDVREAIFLLQVFVEIVTVTALVMAASVAERQHAEDLLRKSEEQFRGMFEGAAIGIGISNLQGRIVESNPALQTMLGYSCEQLRDKTFADYTYTGDLDTDLECFQDMLAGQRDAYQIEKRLIRQNNQVIWVRLTNSLVRDGFGNPKFTIGMAEDITELRQAEESIQLYADIVKSMQMGLIVWHIQDLDDLDTFQLVDINPAARQILQVTAPPEELTGQKMADVFPSLLETAFPKIYAEVARSGKVRDLGEVRYCDEVIPEGVYATKVFPLPNQCVGLVFENITDRKQAEEALQQSEARFRVVAETAACAFLIYQGSHLRYVNPATERITEYSRDELLSMNFWDLAHPDFRPLVQERGLARQRGESVPNRYEIKILTRSGKERWVDLTAGPIYLDGQPAALGTAYDITDRKQAEAQLRFAAERERLLAEIALRIRGSLNLEEILNTTVAEVRRFLQADRVFIAHINKNGYSQTVAESVDSSWSAILGWTIDPSAVQEMKALFKPNPAQPNPNARPIRIVNDTSKVETTPFLTDYYQRCQVRAGMGIALMLEGEMFGVLIANQCSSPREWRPFEISLFEQLATQVEIAIQQGQLYQQVQTLAANLEFQVEERTAELQQRMQELRSSNQVKDLLLHAVSHDLRTPVQGMLMVLNKLRQKCDQTVPVSHSMLDLIIKSCDHQLHLLNSLREDYSATECSSPLNLTIVDVEAIVQAATHKLEPFLVENSVTLVNQIPSGLPSIKADATQLGQVFERLLANAVKHNPPGQTITLGATILAAEEFRALYPNSDHSLSPGDVLYCTVEDTGVGMSQEQCDRLFQLYVRGVDNRHLTGIGVGLHRCRQIITAHGGQIGVMSQPGAGSKFWFTLPVGQQLGKFSNQADVRS